MADEDNEDKTEQASQRRLRSAWEEGKIPMSRDVGMAASVSAGVAALLLSGRAFSDAFVSMLSEVFKTLPSSDLGSLLPRLVKPGAIVFAVAATTAVASLAAGVTQTKGNLWPNLVIPDLSKLMQPSRLTRMLSREFLVDLGLSLLKVAVLTYVLWSVASNEFLALGRLLQLTATSQLEGCFLPLARGAGKVMATVLGLAGVELALTRYRFAQKMKMTKAEAKREYREEEGDPMLRSRRKRRHRELMKGRASIEVPKADALIVNPTHIAIAVRYRKDEGKAPRVTAKGKGVLAEHMRELAREHGIPIVEDIPLARLLYKRVKVGREVPMETYKAVAAILAFVYRVTGRNAGVAA